MSRTRRHISESVHPKARGERLTPDDERDGVATA